MKRRARGTRRDPATASTMTRLLEETHYEVLERQAPSSGLVLADALEQHGHKRLAEDLTHFLKHSYDYDNRLHDRQTWSHWKQIKKTIIQAIGKVRQDKAERSVNYKQLYGGFYRISDAEAYRLARASGWWTMPKKGYAIDVVLSDGRKAELSRTSDSNDRWGWAVLPR